MCDQASQKDRKKCPSSFFQEAMSHRQDDEVEKYLQQEWRRVLGPDTDVSYGEYLAVTVMTAEFVYKESPGRFEKTSYYWDAWLRKVKYK